VRETLGVHTCDRRSPKTAIAERWPKFTFEPDFAEADPLWVPDVRESDMHHAARMKVLLDDIFTHDSNVCISLTAHSGTIAASLYTLGHRQFPLLTGGVIPVLVKAENVVPNTSV
jgi:broad specificity phosphatase PhoE